MKRLIAAILLLAAWPALGADVNGYTAQYECRAGGTYCNVDVATITAQSCQQTITTATTPTGDWSAINWANNVICIDKGDHTGRGTLTLGSSGTSGTRKVLRYYRSGDNDDEPWNQSEGNKAKIRSIEISNQDYWIIHRLTVLPNSAGTMGIAEREDSAFATDNIISRVLVDGTFTGGGNSDGLVMMGGDSGDARNTIQNSVVRNCDYDPADDNSGVIFGSATDIHVVNNEIYNCTKQVFTWQSPSTPGVVIENNDLYVVPADVYTNCSGTINGTGPCSISENGISLKAGGTSGNPGKLIQNRVWGFRFSDTSLCCASGTPGDAIDFYRYDAAGNGTDWVLFQNNIVMDSQYGFINSQGVNVNDNISVIGNIFYDIQMFHTGWGESRGWVSYGDNAHELYLNIFISINNGNNAWIETGSITNSDIRCNVVIDADAATGALGVGTQRNHNVYYGTPDSGETNKLGNFALNTRANSTGYLLNDIIRTTATPPESGAAGDYLNKVTVAGTSAGSPPAYTTTLGGTTVDGTMTVQAIRGPYTFKRKLRTVAGGEATVIPYARFHSSAPESLFCPSTYAGRTGIGIGDE